MKICTTARNESHLNDACKSNIKTVKASLLNLYSVKISIYQHPPHPFLAVDLQAYIKGTSKTVCFCQDIFPPRLIHKAHLKAVWQVILISPSISPKHFEEQRPSCLNQTIPCGRTQYFYLTLFENVHKLTPNFKILGGDGEELKSKKKKKTNPLNSQIWLFEQAWHKL